MKIVQTFWSKPFLTKNKEFQNRFQGGWTDPLYNYISMSFSCLQFRKYYDEVELYTDEFGKDLLINKLKLPYTKVHVVFEDFNYSDKLWALCKVKTYSLQDKPFIHADNDIFIFQKFPERFENSKLLAQNVCIDFPTLYKTMRQVYTHFKVVDAYIKLNYCKIEDSLSFVNCGVIGGSDIDFFKEHAQRAFSFINNNKEHLTSVNLDMMAQVYEEYLYFSMAVGKNLDIRCLLAPFRHDFNDAIIDFTKPYVHAIGTFKKYDVFYLQMEEKFKELYPNNYDLIKSTMLY